jgi:hypothetical protein
MNRIFVRKTVKVFLNEPLRHHIHALEFPS